MNEIVKEINQIPVFISKDGIHLGRILYFLDMEIGSLLQLFEKEKNREEIKKNLLKAFNKEKQIISKEIAPSTLVDISSILEQVCFCVNSDHDKVKKALHLSSSYLGGLTICNLIKLNRCKILLSIVESVALGCYP